MNDKLGHLFDLYCQYDEAKDIPYDDSAEYWVSDFRLTLYPDGSGGIYATRYGRGTTISREVSVLTWNTIEEGVDRLEIFLSLK